MYYKRKIEPKIKKALKQFPAVLITGARQVGKSTMLRKSLPNYNYVTFDDPLTRSLVKEDPELFLATQKNPIIFDEIQNVPELFEYLKIEIDNKRKKNGRYVLTGSQAFPLMKGVTETLAGRIALFHLYPFAVEEIPKLQIKREQVLVQRILNGFYPQCVVQKNLDFDLWFSSYLATYLERDIRNLQSIHDLGLFQKLILLLAARVGNILNLSDLSKELGVSQPTIRKWVSLLESTYVVYLLKPYFSNRSKREVKNPKIYFIDVGLLSYILGIDSATRFQRSKEKGAIFENLVIIEMLKRAQLSSKRFGLYFYRSHGGLEVDLVLDRGNQIAAFEIKFAKTIKASMASSLKRFQKENSSNAYLLSVSSKSVHLDKNLQAVHWLEGLKLF